MSQPDVLQRHPPSAPRASRCRVALEGPPSRYEGELAALLHRRLILVTVLALVPGVLFFVRDMIDLTHPSLGPVTLILRGALILLQGLILGLLLSKEEWTLCGLRKLEVSLVAAMAGLFAWMQLEMYHNPVLFQVAECDYGLEVVRLWIHSTAVRWFFLVVVYGVFIPNTWQRCLLITGLVSALPLAFTLGGAIVAGQLTVDVAYGMVDLVILMGTGMAVAAFGSYRLQLLQQQAFQAQQLGQYRLGARLGAGGMGEVYEAEHVLLRRRCAIKLIRPDQTTDPAALARFEREVQAMAALTHPNTVEVYDYGRSEDGTFYYVMEYLPGLTLEQLVARYGPVPAGRAIHLLRQVCRALREAHGVGLLHRDIKPSNVIVAERGGEPDVAKLLDFGLVQTTGPKGDGRLTLQGVVLGSPPFMSPEQAAGRTDLGPTTDVYSLGGVGYYVLTGRPPFVRETAMEMLLAHAYEAAEAPAGVPADLAAVILRCLSKKPEDRYPDVESVERALLACESAGEWNEEQAAAWWREANRAPDTGEHDIAVTPPLVGV
jgi:tRNA A-37 threonylcarbamoyl transferase component Bud32